MSKIIDASTCILYMTGLCWTMGGLRGCTRQGFASKSVGNGKSQCPIGKFIYIYLYTYIKKKKYIYIYIILYIYTYYVCVRVCKWPISYVNISRKVGHSWGRARPKRLERGVSGPYGSLVHGTGHWAWDYSSYIMAIYGIYIYGSTWVIRTKWVV